MKKSSFGAFAIVLACGIANAAPVSGQGTWETTLLSRNILGQPVAGDDPSAVFEYDTQLNVTWLRTVNSAARWDWSTASTWAETLSMGGNSDWRLPTLSEYRNLYFVTLAAPGPIDHEGVSNTGYFIGYEEFDYWSVESPFNTEEAFTFSSLRGTGSPAPKVYTAYSMTVRTGDVLAVPEPASYALLLVGLGIYAARRIAIGGRGTDFPRAHSSMSPLRWAVSVS